MTDYRLTVKGFLNFHSKKCWKLVVSHSNACAVFVWEGAMSHRLTMHVGSDPCRNKKKPERDASIRMMTMCVMMLWSESDW